MSISFTNINNNTNLTNINNQTISGLTEDTEYRLKSTVTDDITNESVVIYSNTFTTLTNQISAPALISYTKITNLTTQYYNVPSYLTVTTNGTPLTYEQTDDNPMIISNQTVLRYVRDQNDLHYIVIRFANNTNNSLTNFVRDYTSDTTVAYWVQFKEDPVTNDTDLRFIIFSFVYTRIQLDTSGNICIMVDGVDSNKTILSPPLEENKWYLFTLSIDVNGNAKFYKNDTKIFEFNFTEFLTDYNNTYGTNFDEYQNRIVMKHNYGSDDGIPAFDFNAWNTYIWDRILSDNEVIGLYQNPVSTI